jgi:predicted nucleic acid-binding protein
MAKPKVYWDANIFLAWLHEETVHGPGVLDGIEEMAREINDNKAILFTSVMTKTQVLECKLSARKLAIFSNLFKRRNVTMIVQDERVADKAHEIRNHYAQRKITLSAEDCVHLATAILYQADVFYTLDGSGKRPRPNDLLPLNGNVAGYPLVIQKPHAKQPMLEGLAPDTKAVALRRAITLPPKKPAAD